MAERTIEEAGQKIVLRSDATPPEVFIDGKRIEVSVSPDGYWTPLDAYRHFKDLESLARAVARSRAHLGTPPGKDPRPTPSPKDPRS